MATPTINELENNFLSYLQAAADKAAVNNPLAQINAYAPKSIWSILGGAVAAEFLDLYGSLKLIENTIYPQNAVGQQVDLLLYSRGLPERIQSSYASVIAKAVVGSTFPFVIPAGTVFKSNQTGNLFKVLIEYNVPDGTEPIELFAVNIGPSIVENIGNILNFDTYNLNITQFNIGSGLQSDTEAIALYLQSIRAPQGNVRATDYKIFMLKSNLTFPNPQITDAVIIPSFIVVDGVKTLGCFALSGAANISEYVLNQGLLSGTSFIPYSRQCNSLVVANAATYIANQRLVGLNVVTGTSLTFNPVTAGAPYQVTVSLVLGYTLSTLITIESQDVNLNPITIQLTVEQLIQRQVRAAICDQPQGATEIPANSGNRYITTDSVIVYLNNTLSASQGSLAQILINLTISNSDIPVPNYSFNANNIYYTYDIDAYSSIEVTLV